MPLSICTELWVRFRLVSHFNFLIRFVLGIGKEGVDCGINRDMFVDGYFVLPFNLTPSQDLTEGSVDLIREGPTDVKWNTDPGYEIPVGGVELLAVGKWKTIMIIDQLRTVRTDLTV